MCVCFVVVVLGISTFVFGSKAPGICRSIVLQCRTIWNHVKYSKQYKWGGNLDDGTRDLKHGFFQKEWLMVDIEIG